MAISFVQSQSGATTAGTASTFTLTGVGKGHILILCLSSAGLTTISSISDSASNSYSVSSNFAGGAADALLYYAQTTSGGTITVTVNTTTSSVTHWILFEFAGISNPVLDQSATTSATSTSPSATMGSSTTVTNEIIIGAVQNSTYATTVTEGSGYTGLVYSGDSSGGNPCAMEYQIVSSKSAYTATMTLDSSQVWGMIVAGFYGTPPPTIAGVSSMTGVQSITF